MLNLSMMKKIELLEFWSWKRERERKIGRQREKFKCEKRSTPPLKNGKNNRAYLEMISFFIATKESAVVREIKIKFNQTVFFSCCTQYCENWSVFVLELCMPMFVTSLYVKWIFQTTKLSATIWMVIWLDVKKFLWKKCILFRRIKILNYYALSLTTR